MTHAVNPILLSGHEVVCTATALHTDVLVRPKMAKILRQILSDSRQLRCLRMKQSHQANWKHCGPNRHHCIDCSEMGEVGRISTFCLAWCQHQFSLTCLGFQICVSLRNFIRFCRIIHSRFATVCAIMQSLVSWETVVWLVRPSYLITRVPGSSKPDQGNHNKV